MALQASLIFWQTGRTCPYPKGVGKYDKSVEILKMLAAPPMGGKIWILYKFEFIKIFPLKFYFKFKFCRP